jgi:two-component system, NtrC family, sensor kinase
MNIRWKVTALIAALFAVLGVAEIFVAKTILMPSFAELEHTDANIAMRRVQYALDSTLDQLASSAGGWGNWTDAYRFMQDRNRTFVSEQITTEGLKQLNVNALMFVDLEGQFVTSAAHELDSDRPLNLDFMQGNALAVNFPWLDNLRNGRLTRGLLQTNRGLLLIAAAPVLDGYGHGPIRGMVMLGRLLTVAEIKRIGAQAQVDLSMLAPPNARTPDRLVETDNVTGVYRSFDDIYGRPIMTLRVDVPRSITQRGHLAVNYASAYLAGAAVIVLILLMFILDRVVLNPLARVTRHAVAIGEGKDLTTRLDFKTNDEIGVLACEVDRMVASVAESRAKLIDQSFQAGFAELAKGVLHNLGNAMTPIGVRLSGLRDRLRSAPAEDAELAVVELARDDVDPTRRADLEEFVRLACVELASVVRGVATDVEVMSRQTSIVQTTLSEQMQVSRNEHVVESVRLPELLAQALELVPDTARKLLLIDADKSLAKVGVVRVARTVLRLVLQNLIINAADAVRECGKTQGSLHITAEILRESDGDRLHLCCADNGAGIVPDNLVRVFEKGFSTKSKKTNYGIGLHWCANSIGALGGRIWATSEGPGRGASMHFMIPLTATESVSTARAA